MKIVQAIVWVSTIICSLRVGETRCEVCFVLAKRPTMGIAKKVEMQEKRRVEVLLTVQKVQVISSAI